MARRKDSVDARTVARIMAMADARAPMSSHAIADQLNAWHIPTARGGRWHSSTVAAIIRRARPMTRPSRWTCADGHTHRFTRVSRTARDGDPCTMRTAKAKRTVKNARELMGQGGRRTDPDRIRSVVSGGLPGKGKRR